MRKIFITLLILIALMGICYAQTKSISPDGGNIVHIGHGKLAGINESGDTITITTAGTWYQYTTEDESVVSNVTYDSGNHALQINTDGHYLLLASATVSANAADRTIHMGIGKNGTVGTYNQLSYTSKFADRESSVTVTTIGNLSAGDDMTLEFTSSTNGDVVSVYHAQLVVVLLD